MGETKKKGKKKWWTTIWSPRTGSALRPFPQHKLAQFPPLQQIHSSCSSFGSAPIWSVPKLLILFILLLCLRSRAFLCWLLWRIKQNQSLLWDLMPVSTNYAQYLAVFLHSNFPGASYSSSRQCLWLTAFLQQHLTIFFKSQVEPCTYMKITAFKPGNWSLYHYNFCYENFIS